MVSMLSQISMLIQIFITVKESFFWKGVQQWIQQFELPRRQDTWYLESATEIPIGILSWFFFQKIWKILVKEISFGQCYKLYACSFTKKRVLVQTLLKDFACRLSWPSYYRTASLQRTFSILTLPVAASVYANDSVKWKFYKWCVTNPCNMMKFFATLAVGWNLVAKYSFFRSSLK